VDEAYRDWLFHGECFAGVKEVLGISAAGISARLESLPPARLLAQPLAASWIVDPVLVDSAFQLSILWERWSFDKTPLPAGCDRVVFHARPATGAVDCWMATRAADEGGELETDIFFRDASGRLLLEMRNMRFTCTRELNRLALAPDAGGGA
jgi:hypothetical protein